MSKILVIDDDATCRSQTASMLENEGYEVMQADTGAHGVQMARAEQPRLILCDVELVGVGGGLVLYAVRRDPQLAATPFVLMSGCSPNGEGNLQESADGFLSKPFTAAKLTSLVEECLSRPARPPAQANVGSSVPDGQAGRASAEDVDFSLRRILEATRHICTAHEQLALQEIVGLAAEAHQAATRLGQILEQRITPADQVRRECRPGMATGAEESGEAQFSSPARNTVLNLDTDWSS
jgi:two-component system sensor histidine kinase/response regulator